MSGDLGRRAFPSSHSEVKRPDCPQEQTALALQVTCRHSSLSFEWFVIRPVGLMFYMKLRDVRSLP